MKLSFRSLVCLCLAVCGILCSGILLGGRISAEAKDQQVSVAFSQDDLALLAQESGLAVETWREALQQAGISHWIGQEPASFLLPGRRLVLPPRCRWPWWKTMTGPASFSQKGWIWRPMTAPW